MVIAFVSIQGKWCVFRIHNKNQLVIVPEMWISPAASSIYEGALCWWPGDRYAKSLSEKQAKPSKGSKGKNSKWCQLEGKVEQGSIFSSYNNADSFAAHLSSQSATATDMSASVSTEESDTEVAALIQQGTLSAN